jgi:hypothetical protein
MHLHRSAAPVSFRRAALMPAEFICSECGAHVVAITADATPYGALCAHCLHMPGWFRDPRLVAIFDPGRKTTENTNVEP